MWRCTRPPRALIGLTALGVAASMLVEGAASAGDPTVECDGEASIQNDDRATAKKAAVADALRKCVESAVGISIKTEFTSEQREVVSRSQSTFDARVKETITERSEGFVERYEVENARVDGNHMRVHVRARVFSSKVRAEAAKLVELIRAAGNPKVAISVRDVFISPSGEAKVGKGSFLGAHIEKDIRARGFDVRGVGRDSAGAETGDLEKIAEAARRAGADLVIMGAAEIRNQGVIGEADGLESLRGQTRIEIAVVIRGVNTTTGEIVSSQPARISSIGLNEERALHRALEGRGANIVSKVLDQLLVDLEATLVKSVARGRTYVVALRGITSFRDQGAPFLEMVGRVDGVSSAAQKSFDSGVLMIEVEFKGDPSDLQAAIFRESGKFSTISKLDVDRVSGSEIWFKL